MLTAIKLLHTVIWAVFAGSIILLPVVGVLRRFDWALVLTVLILIECGVLALNRGRCPLTDVAAKFTDKRADNFDIYLPNWLARHNKSDLRHDLCGQRIDCALVLAGVRVSASFAFWAARRG